MKLATLGLVLLALTVVSKPLAAQTATFTWIGDATQTVPLSTINNIPPDPANGYGGSIDIVNGYMMWLLDLPQSLGFPNNGFLDCETLLTFSAKQWGTRADGSTMDGSKAGDYYYLPASTSCPLWNGTTQINITEFRQFVAHRYCNRGICRTSLVDTMESGFGTATVQ